MSPSRVAEYILEEFKNSSIKVNIIENKDQILRDYPLMAAVSRSANNVEEHRVRKIKKFIVFYLETFILNILIFFIKI